MKSDPTEALERFKALEGRVGQILDALQKTRSEKGAVEKELAEARRRITLFEKDLDGLRQERGVVRGRVKHLIESIAKLREKQIV